MIVLAPDKFKGTLKAREVAEAMARGFRHAGVEDEIRVVEMADGGEGTAQALGARSVLRLPGAYLLPDGRGLLVSAEICGARLKDVRPDERSSRRLGEVALELAELAPEILIGVGGTLTVDGGAGFLQGLGYRFFDSEGRVIEDDISPSILAVRGLSSVTAPWDKLPRLRGLCDVECPMVGPEAELSAISFIRQKGFDTQMMRELAVKALLAVLVVLPSSTEEYGGAGGGIGYAIGVVPDSCCCKGADAVLQENRALLEQAKLIVTGEGSIDLQTRGGKCVDAMLRFGRSHGVPVLAIGGRVSPELGGTMVIACRPWDADVPDSETAALEIEEAVKEWALKNFVE